MGLLDSLMGKAKSAVAAHESELAPMLLSMLGGGGGQDAQANGLSTLIARFKQAGLGDTVESWISTQQSNKPVTGDQVHSALGDQIVSALAEKTGMPKGPLLAALAALLPGLVDRNTPNGQAPTASDGSPDQTPGEAEAPASTEATAAAKGVGQTDPTEPTQSAQQQG